MTFQRCVKILSPSFCSLFLLIGSPASNAAVISLCNLDAEEIDSSFDARLYSSNGIEMQLLVHDEGVELDHCESIDVDTDSENIQWAGPLPNQQFALEQPFLNLLGDFTAGETTISEITGRQISTPATPRPPIGDLRLEENFLSKLDEVVFGATGRAAWQTDNQLSCQSGAGIAGVQLRTTQDWPSDIPMQLRISASGVGSFSIALSDQARIQSESPLAVGSIGSAGEFERTEVAIELPANDAPWSAITLVCPESIAEIKLESMVLSPVADASDIMRGAWVWSPDSWRTNPGEIWELQQLERLNEIFITVPVGENGAVREPLELAFFVNNASARGIKVWPVIGDPRDVLEESLPILLSRVSAYRDYNVSASPATRLAGVQLDIEPYLLPGFNLDQDHWRVRYIETIAAVAAVLEQQLAVDLVVPFWFGSHQSWGERLLSNLDLPGISLTVMNYRTNAQQLRDAALPFLRWGQNYDKDIRIAVESGSLNDQTQRTYVANATQGRLWKFTIDTTPVLVLFQNPQSSLTGEAFSFASERSVSAGNVTFSGDMQQLNQIANSLISEWNNWPSFAGIAIHGLDEIYFNGGSDENK